MPVKTNCFKMISILPVILGLLLCTAGCDKNENIHIEDAVATLKNKELDPQMRKEAIRTLAMEESEEAVSALIEALGQNNEVLNEMILMALFDMKSPQIPPVLLTFMKNPTLKLRTIAARALGYKKIMEAEPHLLEMLQKDKEGHARAVAVASLRDLGTQTAMEAIYTAVKDTDPMVCSEALLSINNIKTPKTISLFLETLNNPTPQIRTYSLEALKKFEAKEAEPKVREIMNNKEEELPLRTLAIHTLGILKVPDSIPHLGNIYKDKTEPVELRRQVLLVLQHFNTEEAKKILTSALKDKDKSIRYTAENAMRTN